MSKNTKKGPYDLSFVASRAPGYKSRFAKIGEVAPQLHSFQPIAKSDIAMSGEPENLREKFRTGSDPRTLPSTILRRKGIRV